MASGARALVVGSGPNGLAAAIVLLQNGVEVEVREAADRIGGGVHSEELTLPGFVHDVCATVQPLAVGSPFFRWLRLDVEWVHPEAPAAHPFDDGSALLLERGIDETAAGLGRDRDAYRLLVEPLVAGWDELGPGLLGRLPPPPRRTLRMVDAVGAGVLARSVRAALADARTFAESTFETEQARAWLASQLPRDRIVLADVAPRELVRLAAGRFPDRYERRLLHYRHGPGVFKVDWALDGPIPWRAEDCRRAGTLHLGGTLDEISQSEWAAWSGRVAERPFVLLVQPTMFDATRAPAGKHIAWAYCHVPNGSDVDMTERIEAQVERFAPGFRELVLARSTLGPSELEARNGNLVGGDINGGAMDVGQLVRRPTVKAYATPLDGVYLCSSSTPPGGGVHGMCGYHAARAALRSLA